jgi:thiosulfate dehydrogenase [quinone] large subunit
MPTVASAYDGVPKLQFPKTSETDNYSMKTSVEVSNWQTGLLVTLRFLIGWHLLYEGVFKFLKPEWSSLGFLENAQWIFAGVAEWIVSNPGILAAVDLLNTWGLICIGLGLILGLCTRLAAVAGALLVGLYYLFSPPLIGLSASAPMEGNYLIVNKNLIEAVTLLLIAASPAARLYGLDSLLARGTR